MPGFIHDKLDIKLLVLYIAAHLEAPVDFETLTDLALCDIGINYFTFSESFSELVGSGLIQEDHGEFSITEKGRTICKGGESSLALTIRAKCDRQLRILNEALKRKKQIRANVAPGPGCTTVTLSMDDDTGPIFSLTMMVPSEEEGSKIAQRYLQSPSCMYNHILGAVLEEDGGAR